MSRDSIKILILPVARVALIFALPIVTLVGAMSALYGKGYSRGNTAAVPCAAKGGLSMIKAPVRGVCDRHRCVQPSPDARSAPAFAPMAACEPSR
jgi:hypothetical protein